MKTLDFGCTISVKYTEKNMHQLEVIPDFCYFLQKNFNITFPDTIYYLPKEQSVLDNKTHFYYISGPTTFSFAKKYNNSEFSLVINTEQQILHFMYGPMLDPTLKEIIASYILRNTISSLQMKIKYFFAFTQSDFEKMKNISNTILLPKIECNNVKFNRISKFDSDFFKTPKFELYSVYQSELITSNYKEIIPLCYNDDFFNKIKLENILTQEG